MLAGPKKWNKKSRRKRISELGRDILKLLADNFDHVISIIKEDTGIEISKYLAKKMLLTYLGWEGHLYYGATRMNVPWILAYMSNSKLLFGQVIREGELKKALIKLSNITFNERGQLKNKEGEFVDVSFCFIHHDFHHRDNAVVESMKFIVSTDKDIEDHEYGNVFMKEIIIDPMRFQKLKDIPAEKDKRNQELLDMGKDIVARYATRYGGYVKI